MKYGKRLTNDQLKSLTETEQSGNPMFLKTLCDELRIFGEYYQLNQVIQDYLKAKYVFFFLKKKKKKKKKKQERKEKKRNNFSILVHLKTFIL